MRFDSQAQRNFVLLWMGLLTVKLLIAMHLPLFVDEAFYWQEGRHLAPAYSDLPGLTAWLIRIGTEIGGDHVLAVRAPFLLIAALLPCLLIRSGRRWFGEDNGWRTGTLTLLMPLSGTLGVMALPDVPMALATVLCLDAGARLLHKVDTTTSMQLALGLVLGALSHYRFIGVITIGFIALLMLENGRRMLRDPRVWIALIAGTVAWLPLIAWNMEHTGSGLRFQLLERHPWAFHWKGMQFLPIQAFIATPLLFLAMLQVSLRGLRNNTNIEADAWRYFALVGGGSALAYFLLGFFADTKRVSFHWTLPGYLALLPLLPMQLQQWKPSWQRTTWFCALFAMILILLGGGLLVSQPTWREAQAGSKYYPHNFAGWRELELAVYEELEKMPADTQILANDFKIGAELGFRLGDADISVLDHPLNHKHGRASQLQLWGLQASGVFKTPVLLIANNKKSHFLPSDYQSLRERVGPLPLPRIVNVDHGAQHWLLFHLPAGSRIVHNEINKSAKQAEF